MMPAISAVRRAILEEPSDDVARLAWADLLEERGEPGDAERAEFVRVQLELAKPPQCEWRVRGMDCDEYNADMAPYRVIVWCPAYKRRKSQRRRERELFDSLGANPFGWYPGVATVGLVGGGDGRPPHGHLRRGFVEAITCTLADFLAHAGAIFGEQPVMAVTLSDREPYHNAAGCYLWDRTSGHGHSSSSVLPVEIYARLDGYKFDPLHGSWRAYDTIEAARAALSAACVRWGRERAGLPPLGVRQA